MRTACSNSSCQGGTAGIEMMPGSERSHAPDQIDQQAERRGHLPPAGIIDVKAFADGGPVFENAAKGSRIEMGAQDRFRAIKDADPRQAESDGGMAFVHGDRPRCFDRDGFVAAFKLPPIELIIARRMPMQR